MSTYDDAELAALRAIRVAIDEDDGGPNAEGIYAVLSDIEEQHGDDGIVALVVALARFGAAAVFWTASYRDISPAEALDQFEMHKLTQITDAEDDPEP